MSLKTFREIILLLQIYYFYSVQFCRWDYTRYIGRHHELESTLPAMGILKGCVIERMEMSAIVLTQAGNREEYRGKDGAAWNLKAQAHLEGLSMCHFLW